jgi:hypothetical protein
MLSFLVMALACARPALADKAFDDWSVGLASDQTMLYASTSNDSDEILGELCFFQGGNCFWVLGMSTKCDEDDRYPILANSSSGARHLEITCMGPIDTPDGDYLYAFDWKEIEAVIKDASWVGLAFPMSGDAFKVVRFSLKGIGPATEFMEDLFKRGLKNPDLRPKSTKSEIL